jgi:conjugal transfer pilus assembly protein TraF
MLSASPAWAQSATLPADKSTTPPEDRQVKLPVEDPESGGSDKSAFGGGDPPELSRDVENSPVPPGMIFPHNRVQDQAEQKDSKPFYQGRKQGWYWYQKEPVKMKKPKPGVPSKRSLPDLSNYTMPQLWDMYPDDFQALLNTFMKKAVQRPTEKNVLEYLTMQDIARRKSLAYASVTSYVEQKHPQLSTKAVYPVTAPGQAAVVSMRTREQERTIESGHEQFALIMFTREGCDFCEAQISIIAYFVNKYGWPVRIVDIERNPNMAARFNITMTPTIILVDKNSGKYMPISVGVISMSELSLKLYRTIRYLRGEITPEQWFMHDFERGTSNDVTGIYTQQTTFSR